jgi:hypothetical protein
MHYKKRTNQKLTPVIQVSIFHRMYAYPYFKNYKTLRIEINKKSSRTSHSFHYQKFAFTKKN